MAVEEDPNVKYDRERCRICGHRHDEQPRDWGCGYCCPAEAPEVPSRNPGKYWRNGEFYPLGVDHVVQMGGAMMGIVNVVHTNGRSPE